MKYLPKSKLGAAAAGLYLLLVVIVVLGAIFGSKGLHGGAGISALFVYFLSFPLGWVVTWIIDSMKYGTANEVVVYIFLIIFALCFLFNAAVIYLLVGYIGFGLRYLFNRSSNGLK